MTDSPADSVTQSRWRAAVCYLHVNPYTWPVRGSEDDALVASHRRQSQAVFLVGMLVSIPMLALAWPFLVLTHTLGGRLESIGVRLLLFAVFFGPACLVLLYCYGRGAVRAVRGDTDPIPGLRRLSAWPRLEAGYKASMALLVLLCLGCAAFAVEAARATRPVSGVTPRCTLLYDGNESLPRWAYSLVFYPTARVANARWGAGSCVVQPLTEANLRSGLAGKFLFLATHGRDGKITRVARPPLRASDVARHGVGDDLQLVYATACEAGKARQEWSERLAPAEVVTFPRWSSVGEHMHWLLSAAPDRVRALR